MVRALLSLIVLACMAASAADLHLFSDDAPLRLTITAPLPALVRAARYSASTNPYPATLTLTDDGGAPQSFAIQLSPRGHTRRSSGFCEFPPLLVTFDKKAVHGTLFRGQHKLKLVTYCRTPPDYEQRIVLEYLAYRIYNLITPMSFRVRAAEVTYRKDETDAGVTRFSYLIEDIGDVADRNGREPLKAASHQVSLAQLDAHAAVRGALFEYMIGNLDWDFLASLPGQSCCHNSRFVAAPDATPATASAVVPVPYDYDWSGFVDLPYAGPPPSIPVDRLTDRYYRGYCAMSAEVPSVIEEYKAQRAAIMALIDAEPHLNAAFRAKTDRFMDGFFAVLDDPKRVQREVTGHCR